MSKCELTISEPQSVKFAEISQVLARCKHSPNIEKLTSELRRIGCVIVNRRITWSGGVGSCRLMRGGVLRIQVRSSTWAYTNKPLRRSGSVVLRASLSFGYKYAPCVEILQDGTANLSGYYQTGHQRRKEKRTIKEISQSKRKRLFSHL